MSEEECALCTSTLRCIDHCAQCRYEGLCSDHAHQIIVRQSKEARAFEEKGRRMEVVPGVGRPRLVDVLNWGETGAPCNRGWALVQCVESGRKHVYPHHQLRKPCWRCHGARAVYAAVSRKTFDCPACKYHWRARDAYPPNLAKLLGREGPASRGFSTEPV